MAVTIFIVSSQLTGHRVLLRYAYTFHTAALPLPRRRRPLDALYLSLGYVWKTVWSIQGSAARLHR